MRARTLVRDRRGKPTLALAWNDCTSTALACTLLRCLSHGRYTRGSAGVHTNSCGVLQVVCGLRRTTRGGARAVAASAAPGIHWRVRTTGAVAPVEDTDAEVTCVRDHTYIYTPICIHHTSRMHARVMFTSMNGVSYGQ